MKMELEDVERAVEAVLFAGRRAGGGIPHEPVHWLRAGRCAKRRPAPGGSLWLCPPGHPDCALDDAFQMCSSGEMGGYCGGGALETRKPPKLSTSQLEALTVIAYYHPATKALVEQIRGVDSAYAVSALLNKKLIEECGRG